jgi:hypothetical protein
MDFFVIWTPRKKIILQSDIIPYFKVTFSLGANTKLIDYDPLDEDMRIGNLDLGFFA